MQISDAAVPSPQLGPRPHPTARITSSAVARGWGELMASNRLGSSVIADPAEPAVLAAFDAAQTADLPTVDCYRAAVDAWCQAYPDQRRPYAAQKAVMVILAARFTLRIPDE